MECRTGREPSEGTRRALLEELKGLFGPAFGPALAAYGRPFAELVGQDRRFRAEARDRFERGCALGGFPVLSALLSDMAPQEREEFFKDGWIDLVLSPERPENLWDHLPWMGDREAYREDLYSGLAFAYTDLRAFAHGWLEELLRVGYYAMEESLGLPLKQEAGSLAPSPESLPLHGQAHPVRLEGSRQTVWLDLAGPRSKEGQYREVTVSGEPLRTDCAHFAALAMLEGRHIDLSCLREVLPEIVPSHGESVWDRWTELLRDESVAEVLQTLRHHQTLDYLLLLLRYHRPDFDDAPLQERASLLEDACARLNTSLETLKDYMAFVEYGTPKRGAIPAAKSVARDVRMAILKDVEDLTYKQIGERLSISPSASYSYKGDHAAVRKMVGRGRRFLTEGLGDEGYASHIQAMKQEARRRRGLSNAERDAEDMAEAFGISYEDALRRVQEERHRCRVGEDLRQA